MNDKEAFDILSELGDLLTEKPMNEVDPEISELFNELEHLTKNITVNKL